MGAPEMWMTPLLVGAAALLGPGKGSHRRRDSSEHHGSVRKHPVVSPR